MNIVIVDDQPDVVQGILSGVNWEELGVNNTFGAQSSKEAKEIFKNNNINILLTDIEMPQENGLELIKWVRQNYEDVKCLLLTSHADFSYAQKAIQLGACGYLLQPVSYNEIKSSISKIIAQINEEQVVKNVINRVEKYKNKEHELLCRNNLKDYVLGLNTNIDKIVQEVLDYGFEVEENSMFFSLLLQVEYWSGEKWESDLFLYGLENIIDELTCKYSDKNIVINIENNTYFCIIKFLQLPEKNQLEKGIERLQEVILNYLNIKTSVYTTMPTKFSELPKTYKLLKTCVSNSIHNDKNILFYEEGEVEYNCESEFSRWKTLLEQQGTANTVKNEICEHLNEKAKNGIICQDYLTKFFHDFIQMFFEIIKKYQQYAHEIFDEMYDYNTVLKASSSYNDFIRFVEFATEYIEQRQDNKDENKAQIDRILDFIQKNIQRNIGRQDIAEAVYLSPEYLSRFFKKEMGIGLSEYLTKERMKIAKLLLENTSLPISIIASKVGYVNFSHFAKKFKLKYGISPSDFRQSKNE